MKNKFELALTIFFALTIIILSQTSSAQNTSNAETSKTSNTQNQQENQNTEDGKILQESVRILGIKEGSGDNFLPPPMTNKEAEEKIGISNTQDNPVSAIGTDPESESNKLPAPGEDPQTQKKKETDELGQPEAPPASVEPEKVKTIVPPEASYKHGWYPIQLSLFNPVQIFDDKKNIHGFRLGLLYAKNNQVDGFDIPSAGFGQSKGFNGLQVGCAGASDEFNGCQIVAFATSSREFRGMQVAVFQIQDKDIKTFNGFRLDGIGIYTEIKDMNGFLFSGILGVCNKINGFHCGYISKAEQTNGVQMCGAFNESEELNGIQIGLINFTNDLEGFQLGLFNISPNNWLPLSIGINFGF